MLEGKLNFNESKSGFGGMSQKLSSGKIFSFKKYQKIINQDFFEWVELWETVSQFGLPKKWTELPEHTVFLLKEFEKCFKNHLFLQKMEVSHGRY